MQTGRNILYIFSGLVVLLLHSSCNKLTEKPYSSIFTDAFYATASDAEAGLTAVYGPMVDLYNTAGTFASDFSADQIYPRPVVGRDTLTEAVPAREGPQRIGHASPPSAPPSPSPAPSGSAKRSYISARTSRPTRDAHKQPPAPRPRTTPPSPPAQRRYRAPPTPADPPRSR